MSKAISGAAMIGAALTMGVAAFFDPALVANPAYDKLMFALAMGGISMEAGAIAGALTGQRGQNITTRQAAGMRQIVYGTQRVGGTTIYQSTTGSGGSGGNYVYNYIIVLATHEIDSIQNLYLDGRQVYWKQAVDPQGFQANMGQGSVATPPTTTVNIVDELGGPTGVIGSITATGGSGFASIQPVDGYRVKIRGDGSGAYAYATNSGTVSAPVWTVHMVHGGSGYTWATAEIQGAYTFGGTGAADVQDPSQSGYGLGYGIGPGGAHYDFSGLVYCEVRWGDQPTSDSMASLTRNDSAWTPPSGKNLSVAGCAYIYLNVGYSTSQFPQAPEIRLTLNGKNDIYDPRSTVTVPGESTTPADAMRGYSSNWALQVADVLTDPVWGVGDVVNEDQLIAAANVCDEWVATTQGSERNYAQHLHYDTAMSPGEVLSMMMPSAAGRISYISGEWYIWPAYWQGPSFAWDASALIGTPSWEPKRSLRELYNRVNGTYTAPNFPYNCAGNLYDKNGWYYGDRDNVWALAFQPTNFPQYAVDTLHGYSSDEYLAQDGGLVLPYELALRGVLSIVQAQRVAKIMLLRNRQQGSGTLPMSLAALQMQPTTVMQFTFPLFGWSGKYLEVSGPFQIAAESTQAQTADGEESEVPAIFVNVPVIECDPSVYEWSESEELTVYDAPAVTSQIPYTPAVPGSVAVTSSAATAVIGADGSVQPRAQITWTAPEDSTVTSVHVEYAGHGTGLWISAGAVDVALSQAFVAGLVAGQAYDFRVRSERPSGNVSTWVEVDDVIISITLPATSTSIAPIAPAGTLGSIAYSDGTAGIVVNPFTASAGNLSASCLTAQYVISGLLQATRYWVYYVDPNFAGGAITPIATTNESDFLGKLGYCYIGTLITAGSVLRPTAYADLGANSTLTPAAAYDANLSTCATLQSIEVGSSSAAGDVLYGAFPGVVLAASKTLSVVAAFSGSLTLIPATITAVYGSTSVTLLSTTASAAETTYTATLPSGTDLSTLTVECVVGATVAGSGSGPVRFPTYTATLSVYDINVQ